MAALVMLCVVSACGTLAPSPEPKPEIPRAGLWSQAYTGECAGREAETLLVTRFDEMEIAFDDFRLLWDDAGEYSGSAIFIAPMPVDGRDIPYEISYVLRASEAGRFVGTETIIEGGGHGIACPIALQFIGDE